MAIILLWRALFSEWCLPSNWVHHFIWITLTRCWNCRICYASDSNVHKIQADFSIRITSQTVMIVPSPSEECRKWRAVDSWNGRKKLNCFSFIWYWAMKTFLWNGRIHKVRCRSAAFLPNRPLYSIRNVIKEGNAEFEQRKDASTLEFRARLMCLFTCIKHDLILNWIDEERDRKKIVHKRANHMNWNACHTVVWIIYSQVWFMYGTPFQSMTININKEWKLNGRKPTYTYRIYTHDCCFQFKSKMCF